MNITGTPGARLAKKLDMHPAHVTRMCDPEHKKSLTVPTLLRIWLVEPALFADFVRQLSELDAGPGEDWQPGEAHLSEALSQLGDVARLQRAAAKVERMSPAQRQELEAAWSALESIARQAGRDLRRGA